MATIEASIVDFNANCEPTTVLYLDGKEVAVGDYYHDHIRDYIHGFLEGLKYTGLTITQTRYSVNAPENDYIDLLEIPKVWPDGKYSEMAKKR